MRSTSTAISMRSTDEDVSPQYTGASTTPSWGTSPTLVGVLSNCVICLDPLRQGYKECEGEGTSRRRTEEDAHLLLRKCPETTSHPSQVSRWRQVRHTPLHPATFTLDKREITRKRARNNGSHQSYHQCSMREQRQNRGRSATTLKASFVRGWETASPPFEYHKLVQRKETPTQACYIERLLQSVVRCNEWAEICGD